MVKKIVILHNPLAGSASSRKISAVARRLEQKGAEVDLVVMSGLAALPAQIAEVLESAPDILVAAGGDGTLNKIMPHLGKSGIPLAILPVGTANVLAASLNIPKNARALAQYILQGQIREMSPGLANGVYFCCMASVGFDAQVVAGINLKLKRLISKGAYALEALRALLVHKNKEFSITANGQTHHAYGAIVTLTPHYAGRYLIAPQASPFARDFAIVLFKGKSRVSLLRYAYALASGKMENCDQVEFVMAPEVDIHGSPDSAVQADGDSFAGLPLHLCRAENIRIVVPAGPSTETPDKRQ